MRLVIDLAPLRELSSAADFCNKVDKTLEYVIMIAGR